MFSKDTTDKDIQHKLNTVCPVYQLPGILGGEQPVLESTVKTQTYRNSIFPTNTYNDEALSERASERHDRQGALIVGQSIANNSGIPLNPINKIPSYQWSFKHEEDQQGGAGNSHHGHGHHYHHHHKKNMLSGLGTTDSVSLLGGTSFNSTALNSKLLRLPVRSERNKHKERSLLNGLPYYNKDIIDRQIRTLNVEKARLHLPAANASYFSPSFNKSVDDVEYLHGEVILNQFLNNKRAMRNYQWMLYYLGRKGGKGLKETVGVINGRDVTVRTTREFQKVMEKRAAAFAEVQRKRAEIAERRKVRAENRRIREEKALEAKAQAKKAEEEQQSLGMGDDLGEFFSTDVKKEEDEEEGENAEDETKEETEEEKKDRDEELADQALEASLPEEDEVEVDEEDETVPTVEEGGSEEKLRVELDQPAPVESTETPRFPPPGNVVLPDKEIIIEKEIGVDDPELIEYQKRLFGIPAAHQMEQQVIQSDGHIQSKRVRVKRIPNANALGYSNVHRKRPSFLD